VKKLKIFIIYLILTNPIYASMKDDIILNLKKTNNLSFYFKQTIDEKIEEGECIIKYPKKIYCSYNNFNKKIMVSNGKSLVIQNRSNNQYYIYPLKKTPLELILDKNYIIKQIKKLEGRVIENKYLNYTLLNNDQKINIFFDKKTLYLIGWQTEDIYQNLVITFISKIKINEKIDNNIFKLPSIN
jgi:outer membrane lipoprotein-sorting protein|tara:strand:+ start:2149 stop:2703 length:555 start_codon:yes stop_codon:yes gene_type:complete